MQHRPFGFSAVLARLYSRKVPGRGNIHTVNVGKMNRISQGMFETNHRANIRTIMSFHEDSFVITDGGSSERFY